MKHIDLFSGIGGFSLACEWAGIETILFCECNKFCQKVLKKHWPDVPCVEDVNNVEEITRIITNAIRSGTEQGHRSARQPFTISRSNLILTAGFPCQPFSNAGRKRGAADDRYLWPQTLAVIETVKPDWIILENVPGILNMVFPDSEVGVASQSTLFGVENDKICDYSTISGGIERDLRQAGYETVWIVIPACGLGAPHRRDRVWIVANSKYNGSVRTEVEGKHTGLQPEGPPWQVLRNVQPTGTDSIRDDVGGNVTTEDSHASDTSSEGLAVRPGQYDGRGTLRQEGQTISQVNSVPGWSENWYEVATRFCRVDDGLSHRVDRLKALGNAIVPQVASQILKAIVEVKDETI